jgi:hypothetical protein
MPLGESPGAFFWGESFEEEARTEARRTRSDFFYSVSL